MDDYGLYKLLLKYFIMIALLILLSGMGIYMLENQELLKSSEHILEVATPHVFSMTLMVFIVGHLLLFSTRWSKSYVVMISVLLFLSVVLMPLSQLSSSVSFVYPYILGFFVVSYDLFLGSLAVSW